MVKTSLFNSLKSVVLLTIFFGASIQIFLYGSVYGQTRKNFRIPDIPGYITLKGDFHMHTPFSDGSVWPADRLKEAWRDGLDVVAITDHIEYTPNKNDVSTDKNRPYEIAKPVADAHGIILIKAAEITRPMPPGHFNALFLEDANALNQKDIQAAFDAAAAQGAFFIWNHPGWKAQQPDSTIWFPMHIEYLNRGWMQGIEIFNEKEYYPIVLTWAKEKNLTVFANSDVHEPIDFLYEPLKKERRPMTLVYAMDRSIAGVREALENRRTLAYFNDTLAGGARLLEQVVQQSITLQSNGVQINNKNEARIILTNNSDIPFSLTYKDGQDAVSETFTLNANSSEVFRLRNLSGLMAGENDLKLAFRVNNAFSEPGLPVSIFFDVKAFSWGIPGVTKAGENLWKIELPGRDDQIEYYYTIGNQLSNIKFTSFRQVFQARDSVKLNLVAYKGSRQISDAFSGNFYLHQGLSQYCNLVHEPDGIYAGNGGRSLLDGITATANYRDGNWIGFEKNYLEALIEFDEPRNIKSVACNFLENNFSWIFLPESFLVLVSRDGYNFTELGYIQYPKPAGESNRGIVNASIRKNARSIKFVKVIARNPGICPEWHPGAGKPAWIFVDEIQIW